MSSISNAGTDSHAGQHRKCALVEPSVLLVRFSDFLPRAGRALDLACGYGRNTLYLARQGLSAIGVDRSQQSLAAGREKAVRSGLDACFVQADLTRFSLPPNTLSVVVCFRYRNRGLYPSIRAALRPGGLLIYETYTRDHAAFGLRPRNPEHLLERNELLRAFGDWEIIFYREVRMRRGIASLVARKRLSTREC